MRRLTAQDFHPDLLALYDGYVHGKLSRRDFLDRAAAFAVAGLSAAAILESLSPDYALATQVEFTDPDIVAEYITYPRPMAMARCAVIWCGRPSSPARWRAWWWRTKTAV